MIAILPTPAIHEVFNESAEKMAKKEIELPDGLTVAIILISRMINVTWQLLLPLLFMREYFMSKSELTALPVSSLITEAMPTGLSLYVVVGRVCDNEDSVECIGATSEDQAESIFTSLLINQHKSAYGSVNGDPTVYVERVKKLTEMNAIGLRNPHLA